MNTPICPTCGCSLVRLGIKKDYAVVHHHKDEKYYFCCQGCVDVFITDPSKYLQETNDLIVCPTCLAEKYMHSAVSIEIDERKLFFCRCPHCVELFQKNPDFYIKRLEGDISNEGVLDHEGCCIRPD